MIALVVRMFALSVLLVELVLVWGCAAAESGRSQDAPSMPPPKQTRSLGIPWEDEFGYVEGVKAGSTIHVAGQLGVDEHGDVPHGAGMEAQFRRAYANVKRVLELYNAKMEDVVEETIYVTDMKTAIAVAPRVRREVYAEHPAVASTLVQVQQLPLRGALVAVAVTASSEPASSPPREQRGGSRRHRGGGTGGYGGMGGGFPGY